jgi:hypothetical protein
MDLSVYEGDRDAIGYFAIIVPTDEIVASRPTSKTPTGEKTPLIDIEQPADTSTMTLGRSSALEISKLNVLHDVMEPISVAIDLLVDHRKYFEPHSSTQNYKVAYEVADEILYICAAKPDFSTRIMFSFLEAMKALWLEQGGIEAVKFKADKFLKFQAAVTPIFLEQMVRASNATQTILADIDATLLLPLLGVLFCQSRSRQNS